MSDDKKLPDQATEDPELNDLLDSALEDFNKVNTTEPQNDTKPKPSNFMPVSSEVSSDDDSLTQDYIKEAIDEFDKTIQNFVKNGPGSDSASTFQTVADSLASAVKANETTHTDNTGADFQSAVARAMANFSIMSENLQSGDLPSMVSQMSLDDQPGDIFLPFMRGMMKSLLSKDILYPSLKELMDKYPGWLEEKKTTLPPADLQRFSKQLDLIKKICRELEEEKEDDTEEIKNKRFDLITSLMQEMHNCGQPPEDLLGEQPAAFQLDPDGNPVIPTLPPGMDAQSCCLM